MGFSVENNFQPDPTKQVQEIVLNMKKTAYFINTPVNSVATHKHLGMILDSKLSYENHLQSVFSRVNKTSGLLRKLQPTLPRKSLVTIYKLFIRPHLYYSDVSFD